MDLYRIISELVEERNRVQRIIESLEAMEAAAGRAPRPRLEGKGRKSMGHAARREVSERMKLYWAKKREDPDPDPENPASAASA